MPGITYHLILVTPDGGIATYGYSFEEPRAIAIRPVFPNANPSRSLTYYGHRIYIGDTRVGIYVDRNASSTTLALSPLSRLFPPSTPLIHGPVIICGVDDGLVGGTAMGIVDILLEDIEGSRMIPWPGREPDEETIP